MQSPNSKWVVKVLTDTANEKVLKRQSLRNNEYYSMQETFDKLYKETITKYLQLFKLTQESKDKVNKLRVIAGNEILV